MHWLSPLLLLAMLTACVGPPPFVVLSIEDASGAAAGFATLHVGFARDALSVVAVNTSSFPLALTVTSKRTGEETLWLEARDGDGNALARGKTQARFASKGTPTATIQLAAACTRNGECNLGLFCQGTRQCLDAMCVSTGLPCVSSFSCVHTTCVELGGGEGTCRVSVDHLACASGEYCNPAAGCIPGQGCQGDDDCQDTYECNGAERCINFVCTAGMPPLVNDGDACTLDGCDDGRTSVGAQPVFHLALASFDSSACTIPMTGEPGVCVSAKGGCALSECGDGVIFVEANEACDDGPPNSDAWSPMRHCNASCSGWAPYCGNGHLDVGDETCDDSVAADTGNGCSSACQRNDLCGDGLVQALFEQCDDQDTDNCDGCRNDCQRGCVCTAPGACLGATWCDQGQCVDCATPQKCGPSCASCGGDTPLCGGSATGCVCSTTPTPNGSCGRGARCSGATCVPCGDETNCGQDCGACVSTGNAPLCGGPQAGCVANTCAGQPDFMPCRVVTAPDRWYDICVAGACVSPGCAIAACNPPGPSFAHADVTVGWEYPDTNQRICYDTAVAISCATFPCTAIGGPAFCGQDAQYGWDTTHAASLRWSRTADAEPVVTDSLTDLVWQGCPAGVTGSACDGGTLAAFFWTDAVAFCNTLTWDGFGDWRLPDYYELQSILDASVTNPAIDLTAFPGTPANWFWTSTVRTGNPTFAWDVNNNDGYVYFHDRNVAEYVRCVRSTRPWAAAPRFSPSEPVAGQRVVNDSRTKLLWQGCAAGQSGAACATGTSALYTWQAALAYCEGLTWAGYSNWRLPNRAELASIVDARQYNPMIDAAAFPATSVLDSFWTSTPWVANAWYVAHVNFAEAYVMLAPADTPQGARCVRPGL